MLKSKKINLQSLKKILVERGFVVKKKKNNFNLAEFKSFYFTVLSGFVLILIFSLIPLSVNIKDNIKINKSTVDNNSNIDFQRVLDGKEIGQKK